MNRGFGRFPRRCAATLVFGAIFAVACIDSGRCDAAPLEAVAGWEGDGFEQSYGFVSVGTSIHEGTRTGVPFRVSGSFLRYNYREREETIDVQGPGCSAMTGIRRAGPGGQFAVLAGGEIRWEQRDRTTGSTPLATVARGSVVGQFEADFTWGRRLRPFVLVTYSGSARYAYGRTGFRWQATNLDWKGPRTWSLGLEGTGQGNSDTDAIQGGALVECALVRSRLSLSLHGGYKDNAFANGRRRGGYLGLGAYRRF